MSKDKGTKNVKKAPADKSKGKAVSSYKSESKSSQTSNSVVNAFSPKAEKNSTGKK